LKWRGGLADRKQPLRDGQPRVAHATQRRNLAGKIPVAATPAAERLPSATGELGQSHNVPPRGPKMEYSTSGSLLMTDEVPDGVESTFLSFAIFILSWLCPMA
jgi:hypothetical protein